MGKAIKKTLRNDELVLNPYRDLGAIVAEIAETIATTLIPAATGPVLGHKFTYCRFCK